MSSENPDGNNSNGDRPWRNRSIVDHLYTDRKLSIREVSEELGCSYKTASDWIHKHGIETRDRGYRNKWENARWRDADVLNDLHHKRGLSTRKMADELNCDPATIIRWMEKHGIERRNRLSALRDAISTNYARFQMNHGHETWQVDIIEDGNKSTKSVKVHRLLAVSEHGFEAINGKVVHHRNGIPWDNRIENLEIMSNSEHSQLHWRRGDISGEILHPDE